MPSHKKSRSRSRSRSPKKSPKVFCLACKKKTDSSKVKIVKDSRGRKRMSCVCDKCGLKKSMYVAQ